MSLDPRASQPIYPVKRQDSSYGISRSPAYRTASPSTTEPGAISRSPEEAYYGAQGLTGSPPRVTIPSWGPTLSSSLVDPRQQVSPTSTPSSRTVIGRVRSTTGVQTENSNGFRVTYSPPSTASTISTTSSLSSSGHGHSATRRTTIPSPISNKPVPLEWENVFHPSFLPNIPDFASEWSFTGLYTSHILFTQWGKMPPYKKLLIYNIQSQTADITKFKYDTCGLGPGGVYLLYRCDHEMHLYDVANKATIKSASLRNLTRWSYNAQGFCILDEAGNFWRWSFNDRLPPSLVFRLANRAPRARLRCLTTRDGAWNAIVAVSRDRSEGLVHCYPTDNDESRIFPGVLAAFIQTEIDNVKVTHIAVVEIINEEDSSDRTLVFTINQLGASVPGAIRRVETRMPYEATGGPPSALFIDHKLAMAVVLVTPPKENYVALLFDLRAGTFLMKQTITKYEEDNWLVDDTGIFRERSGCIVQRLNIRADGLPPRVSAQPRGGLPPLSPIGSSPTDRERYGPGSPNSPQMPPRKSSLPVMANDFSY